MSISRAKCSVLWGGRRVSSAECKAMEDYRRSYCQKHTEIEHKLTSAARESRLMCPMLEPVIPETKASFDVL